MTIAATPRTAGPYVLDGVTTYFDFSFKVFSTFEVGVSLMETATGAASILPAGYYSVRLNPHQSLVPGGTVLTAAPLIAGWTLTIFSQVANTQSVQLSNYGGFYPEVINDALDRATVQVQQIAESGQRTLRLPVQANLAAVSSALPMPQGGRLLAWNAGGTAIVNVTAASLGVQTVRSSAYAEVFSGTGSQSAFELSEDPSSLANLGVSLNGLMRLPGVDYSVSGNVLTTTTPVADGAKLLVRYKQPVENWGGSSDAVTYLRAEAGATSRSVQARLRESVSVLDFGANPNGIVDSTAAVQAAISTGLDVFFPRGTYLVTGLTVGTLGQTGNRQRLTALGHVRIVKSNVGANPLITVHSDYSELNGIQFNGFIAPDGYPATIEGQGQTNVYCTGSNMRMLNCASMFTTGVPVIVEAGHVQILGTCASYTTANTDAATAWDIIIGKAGTATFYHQLEGIYTSTSYGGVKFIDTGSHVLDGGQIGKLSIIDATPGLGGRNGGMTSSCRILGDVHVGLSNATFTGNQFGSAVNLSFGVGTSGCVVDQSNSGTLASVTSAGNNSMPVIRALSTGDSRVTLKYGVGGNCVVGYAGDSGNVYFSHVVEALGLKVRDTLGVSQNAIQSWDSSSGTVDNLNYGYNAKGYVWVMGGERSLTVSLSPLDAGGAPVPNNHYGFASTKFVPTAIAAKSLGSGVAGERWTQLFADTVTISVSDAREKQQVEALTAAELAVATALKGLVRKFKFNRAVADKGDDARIHVGLIAQDVVAAFAAQGLDATRYGILCHDEWDAEDQLQADGSTVARAAGDLYSVRYEELLAFIIAAI